jgi:hypothetical protein
MGYGPVPAIRGLLKSSGLTIDQAGFSLPRAHHLLSNSFDCICCRLTFSKSTRLLLASVCALFGLVFL